MAQLALTPSQLHAIVVTERVNSVISILSVVFITTTYLFVRDFNKLINKLIFFACLGNLGTNVAALMGPSGVASGKGSPLCQFQGFLVQMSVGIDGLWALCMAINVYLAFFCNVSVDRFRKLDSFYLCITYGLAFVPAFIFIFVKTPQRGLVYGPATLYCWIDEQWAFLRISLVYACVWLAMISAFIIYIRAGLIIYRQRKYLSGFLNPLNEDPFKATVTREVEVTSEPIDGSGYVRDANAERFHGQELQQFDTQIDARDAQRPSVLKVRSFTRQVAVEHVNPEAWLYARVAFLFYIALCVTWIPSSANRIFPLATHGRVNFTLSFLASFFLPLQAFWNLVVYVITSQSAMRNLFRALFCGGRGRRPSQRQLRREDTAGCERLDDEEALAKWGYDRSPSSTGDTAVKAYAI